MEAEDELNLTREEPERSCLGVHNINVSGSGSDDNREEPPSSFSIHAEQLLLGNQEIAVELDPSCDAPENQSSTREEEGEIDEEEEQPPVTWFVTKPTNPIHDQTIHTHPMFQQFHGMEWQQSRLCKLCLVRRKKFYCIACVNKGEFSHSNACYPGNLSEKKDQLAVIEKKTEGMVNEIKARTETRIKRKKLEEDIRMNRQRINYFQKLIQATKEKRDRTLKHTRKLSAMNDAREQRLPLFVDKVSKIRQYTNKYFAELDKEKERVVEKNKILDALRHNHVKKLFELVFPMEKVILKSPNKASSSSSETSSFTTSTNEEALIESLMADAMSTSYVNGQGWITLSQEADCPRSNTSTICDSAVMKDSMAQNDPERVVYKIAGPYLSADGDYSRFPSMVKIANDQVQSSIPPVNQQSPSMYPSDVNASRVNALGMETEDEINSVYTVSAGLTFTAQLVSQIATYLDVILPKHLSFYEFGVPIASDFKFAKKVAQLNLNIIFLCLKIGMHSEQIQPSQGLHNLYQLFTELLLPNNSAALSKMIYNKEEVAENLYQMSLANARYLDQLSPTNDDMLNDSDDDCADYDKNQREMEDWEAVSLGAGGNSSDMMIVNLAQFNATPSSPIQSPGPYGVGQAANTATSFVSSIFRGFTGASSPTNTNVVHESNISSKK